MGKDQDWKLSLAEFEDLLRWLGLYTLYAFVCAGFECFLQLVLQCEAFKSEERLTGRASLRRLDYVPAALLPAAAATPGAVELLCIARVAEEKVVVCCGYTAHCSRLPSRHGAFVTFAVGGSRLSSGPRVGPSGGCAPLAQGSVVAPMTWSQPTCAFDLNQGPRLCASVRSASKDLCPMANCVPGIDHPNRSAFVHTVVEKFSSRRRSTVRPLARELQGHCCPDAACAAQR